MTDPYKREITDVDDDIMQVSISQQLIKVTAGANWYPSKSNWLTPAAARELVEALNEALLVYAELHDEPDFDSAGSLA